MREKTALATRLTSSALCAALLLASPGLAAYAAAGQIVSIKVSAPVALPSGLGAVSLGSAASGRLSTDLGALRLSGVLTPAAASPVTAAPGVEAAPSLPVLAAPAAPVAPQTGAAAAQAKVEPVAPQTAVSPAPQIADVSAADSSLLAEAQALEAQPGRLAAPAARVRSSLVQTIRALFSSRAEGSEAAVSVPAAASLQAPALDKAGASAQDGPRSVSPAPSAPAAPAAPAASKLATVMRWALPILAMTALVFGLDVGTKFLAAKFLFTAFHECAWRAPVLAFIIPYIGFAAYKARSAMASFHTDWRWSAQQLRNGRLGFYRAQIAGIDEMIKDHPSLRWAVRLYDVSIALMLGGMLGNGLDALRLGGALDWIPLGRSLMNFADVALLPGLAFFQLATHFFIEAGVATRAGKPLRFSTVTFLGLPLLGFFIAWAFGSAAGGGALDLAMKSVGYLYLMGFSMLLGISRFLAALVVDRFAGRFIAEQGEKKAAGK